MSLWAVAILAVVLFFIVLAIFSGGAADKPTAEKRAPERTPDEPPARPPVLAGHDDDDDELTIAAKVRLPKIPHDPASTRAIIAEPVAPEVDTDEESEEHTGVIQLILVNAVARTDAGRKRTNNEDSYLILKEQNLFVVADGMGGHAGGEVASKLAVDTVQAIFVEQEFPGTRKVTRYKRGNELLRAIELANDAVRARNSSLPRL